MYLFMLDTCTFFKVSKRCFIFEEQSSVSKETDIFVVPYQENFNNNFKKELIRKLLIEIGKQSWT